MQTDTITTKYTPAEALNIQVVRDWVTAFNENDMDAIDGQWTADALDHSAFPDQPRGAEGLKLAVQIYRSFFPDIHFMIDDIIAHDDIVAVRYHMRGTHAGDFNGILATNKEVSTTGMNFFRMEEGKIAENWLNFDVATLMAQMQAATA